MPRRTHKKSRNGCIECKRRHMKCDEQRPVCSNCISSARDCQFVGPVSILHSTRSVSREPASVSPAVLSSTVATPDQQPDKDPEYAPVNMLHVELVHNFSTETLKVFHKPNTASSFLSFHDMFQHCREAPYLMNELLSLSSLHLSITRPGQQKFYRDRSTELQNHALSSFNGMSSQITDDNCVPVFLFAGVLGLHMLCETLVCRETDFESFLDRFVQYVIVHHGVRVVTGQGRWQLLQNTALKPLFEFGEILPPLESSLGPVCETLINRIQGLGLDDAIFRNYEQTVRALQSIMTIIEDHDLKAYSIDALVAWPVLVSRDYIHLVAERKGEALVILAYFGALLDTQRDKWVFCDGGRFLVDSVSHYLGSQWEEWLEWPQQTLVHSTRV
ncbi:uncharacterized protein N7511_000298 [Penicillium nucicola]|uniref:uncharacterized protein n=1 Tax=Penicillium nucicola TaxID=1850975 RepID=UPI00254538C3|nr:uncharacterized protein N7511_000298 [Penicillium nucicola]KAJ5775287.1 hypothetical protein N7511_000298 [Penicillium nucicola]